MTLTDNFALKLAAPDDPRLLRLIRIHKDHCNAHTPAGSGHALDKGAIGTKVDARPVTFWMAISGDEAVGCIGFRQLGLETAEIKTMHVVEAARSRGLADRLLGHVVRHAQSLGVRELRLETGRSDGFAASRRFYARAGFKPCAPYGDYADDPFSVCMAREMV